MHHDSDEDRIRRKAHELWVADGQPHGRDQDHWDEAREIIAIEDSQKDTLLPRDFGAEEPVENAQEALRNLADFPNLTDQGENLLTSTDREPTFAGDADGMPSVEVPTSDQPGIPASRKTASAKAGTAPKAAAKPPTTAATASRQKSASAAKVAQSETVKSKPASSAKTSPTPAKKK